MDTSVKKHIEQMPKEKVTDPVRLFNPDALDFTKDHRISSIEATDTYTRIDFIYRSSHEYVNGGWIQMDAGCYIIPTNSSVQYKLIRAIGIPIAPQKHFFKRCGEFHTYADFSGVAQKYSANRHHRKGSSRYLFQFLRSRLFPLDDSGSSGGITDI